MELSISGLIAQILNFGLLFWLFKKYLTKPITQALEERKSLIHKLSNAEEEYKKKIAIAEKESQEIITSARKSKEKIIADAGILGEKKKQTIVEDANKNAEKIIQEAQEKKEVMERNLKDTFEQSIKSTSAMVLKKLIKNSPEIKDAYISETIQSLKE